MKRILIHFLQVLGGSRGESADLIGIAGKAGPRFLKISSSEVVPFLPRDRAREKWLGFLLSGLLFPCRACQFSDNLGGRTVRPAAKGLILATDRARGWLGYLGHHLAPST